MGNTRSIDETEVRNHCAQFYQQGNRSPDFNQEDIRLIQRVWKRMCIDSKSDVGVEIFKRIFDESKDVQKLFGVKENDKHDLASNGRLISHSRILKSTLDHYIKNMNSEASASLAANLKALGARHVGMSKQGFDPQYWFIFAKAIIDMAASCRIPLLRRRRFLHLWIEMICFVIVNMQQGYENEMNLIEKQSKTS